jgi:hypothetical protein
MRKKDYSIFLTPILNTIKQKEEKPDYYKSMKKKHWFMNNITFLTVVRRAGEYGIESYRAKWWALTPYFEKIGSYESQWINLWFLLDS